MQHGAGELLLTCFFHSEEEKRREEKRREEKRGSCYFMRHDRGHGVASRGGSGPGSQRDFQPRNEFQDTIGAQ